MLPLPRKTRHTASTTTITRPTTTTTTAFNQTWDDKDATSFDPTALPVAKIPRGWERKPQISKVGQGKEKKIWRRHGLRSRASDALPDQEAEAEEQDALSRPVKRRQHMSPKAMEKTKAVLNGTKRAFKATRWDRRKSVLPRKRPMRAQSMELATGTGNDDSHHHHVDEEQDNSTEINMSPTRYDIEKALVSVPEVDNGKGTFPLTMDAAEPGGLSDYESTHEREEETSTRDSTPTEAAMLADFFRSPAKSPSTTHIASCKNIFYPQLPLDGDPTTRPNASSNTVSEFEARAAAGRNLADDSHTESLVFSDAILESVEVEARSHVHVAYPPLPTEAVLQVDADGELSDTEMSDSVATPHVDEDSLEMESSGEELSAEGDEDFTEASLQLDIQRQCDEQSSPPDQEIHAGKAGTKPKDTTSTTSEPHAEFGAVADTETQEVKGHGELLDNANTELLSQLSQKDHHQNSAELGKDDITNGLTLSFTPAMSTSIQPTPRKLYSPPPPSRAESGLDDVTMTIAIDDDTAILKDFLTRAAASKAEKAATHRRESLQNRRDSDVIRNALASPRKALEDKDPNSPSKFDGELTTDLSQTFSFSIPDGAELSPVPHPADDPGSPEEKSQHGSTRRSSRAKKSRLPAPASTSATASNQQQTSKINIRRADGAEVVVLKKSDAQELATLTRANTRKNKQGAFGVTVRLFKLAADATSLPPIDDTTKEIIIGKNVRWDETLAYYQESPETLAEAESLATPDELSMDPASTTPRTKRSKVDKNAPPKARRVRTVNGTPGKGLLTPASILPEAVQEEKEKAAQKKSALPAQPQQLPRPKASKIKRMPVASNLTEGKLPHLDVAPVGVSVTATATASRKSRLAAPKKVVLPQTAALSSGLLEGKENALRMALGDATPKKGIPAPKVMVPSTVVAGTSMESALPRRRGRKYGVGA
ncbi:hypothetical protein IAQ61_009954 [Plenodomus lingam]|nr:hypothetical protein IAQ61_009954 [Plenodomus lingam]